MTSIEEHKRIQEELEEDINEKVTRNIITKRQKIIGFATSEASTNLFAVLLHKLDLITAGFNVNHRFFASIERAKERFNYDFPNKNRILELLVKQEKFRDLLCYGKNKSDATVKEATENYFELKKLIETEIQKIKNE